MNFEQIYHTHYTGMFRYAFTILRDEEESRDMVQNVFSKLWEKKDELDIKGDVKYYLFRSVRNECLNHIDKSKVRVKHHTSYEKENSVDEKPYADEHTLDDAAIAKKIELVMELMPPQCKEVFLKSRIEELKYAEIAEQMNISVKTVEAHMSKALKIIRQAIGVFVALACLVVNYIGEIK